MQGLKWRLSLYSSKPHRQLKRLWTEANGQYDDKELTPVFLKHIHAFFDALLTLHSNHDQAVLQRAIEEEIGDEILQIFGTIMNVIIILTKVFSRNNSESPAITANVEQRTAGANASTAPVNHLESHKQSNGAIDKALSVIELLSCSGAGIKNALKERISSDHNECLGHVFEALNCTDDIDRQLILIRILKALIVNETHLLQIMNLNGFDTLARIALESKESVLVTQVTYIYRAFLTYLQHTHISAEILHQQQLEQQQQRMHSAVNDIIQADCESRAFSFSANVQQQSEGLEMNSSSQRVLHRIAQHDVPLIPDAFQADDLDGTEEHENDSIAGKSIAMALNFVSEMLKYTPVSAQWVGGKEISAKEKFAANMHALELQRSMYEERLFLAKSAVVHSSHLIEEEERVLCELDAIKVSEIALESTKVHAHSSCSEMVTADKELPLSPKDKSAATDTPISLKGSLHNDAATGDTQIVSGTDREQLNKEDSTVNELRFEFQEKRMTDVVLLAIDMAKGPTEAIDVLALLQTVIVGSSGCEIEFSRAHGYLRILAMLTRIESNLSLLIPTTATARAAAIGLSTTPTNSIGTPPPAPGTIEGDSSHHGSRSTASLYLASVGNEFDSYYNHIVEGILRILFDDPSENSQLPLSFLHKISPHQQDEERNFCPYIPVRHKQIKNLKACELIISLLGTGRPSLVMVAIRTCFASMRANPDCVVIFEFTGISAALIRNLVSAVTKGTLYKDNSLNEKLMDFNGVAVDNESDVQPLSAVDLYTLVVDALFVLQIMAIASSDRDNSILAFLIAVVVNLVPATISAHPYEPVSPNLGSQRSGRPTILTYVDGENGCTTLSMRCQNCEMESARFQCLHESCVRDQCANLCHECDKVFHKSAMKRVHVRVPCICIDAVESSQPQTPLNLSPRYRESLRKSFSQPNDCASEGGDGPTDQQMSLAEVAQAGDESIEKHFEKFYQYGPVASTSFKLLAQCVSRTYLSGQLFSLWNLSGSEIEMSLNYAFRCAILATVRTLLDDRRARYTALPLEVLPGLYILLRNIVTESVTSPEVDQYSRRFSNLVQLQELVNFREDLVSETGDPIRKQSAFSNYQQPPDIHADSPRRIMINILVQIIGRFFIPNFPRIDSTGDNDLCERNSSELHSIVRQSLELSQIFAIDAILVHLILDNSSFSPVTAVERQYIIWLFRECAVSAMVCASPQRLVRKYIAWLLWLMKGAIETEANDPYHTLSSNSGSYRKVSSRRQSVSDRKGLKSMGAIKRQIDDSLPELVNIGISEDAARSESSRSCGLVGELIIPTFPPVITLPLRFLVVQEVRLLITPIGGELTSDTAHNTILSSMREEEKTYSRHSSTISHMQVMLPKTIRSAAVGASANSSRESLNSRSFASTTDSVKDGGLRYSNGRFFVHHSCLLLSTNAAKLILVEMGVIRVLLHMIIGSLRSRAIEVVMDCASITASSSGDTCGEQHRETLTELEREDWWLCLCTFCQLLSGFDEAKLELDKTFGIQRVVKVFLNLVQGTLTCIEHDIPSWQLYRSIFTTFIAELCVMNGCFAENSINCISAITRFPSIVRSNTVLQTHANASDEYDSEYHRGQSCEELMCNRILFEDKIQHDTLNLSECQIQSSVILGPAYFVNNRAVVLMNSTLVPHYAELTSDTFSEVFEGSSEPRNMCAISLGAATAGYASSFHPQQHERRSIRGQSFGATDAPCDVSSMSRRFTSRNISTASLASFGAESEANRWELDSTGFNSSTHGDIFAKGSASSIHSIVALSQALGSKTHTPTPSLHGDTASISNPAVMDRSSGRGSRYVAASTPYSSIKLRNMASEDNLHDPAFPNLTDGGKVGGKVTAKNYSYGGLLTEKPFPPMARLGNNLQSSASLVYSPLLCKFDTELSPHYSAILLLLHHSLLMRSGYSDIFFPDLGNFYHGENTTAHHIDDSNSQLDGPVHELGNSPPLQAPKAEHMDTNKDQVQDSSDERLLDYRVMLRKHLSMFAPPSLSGTSRFTATGDGNSSVIPIVPEYSKLQIRSLECAEVLLSSCLLSAEDVQLFLLSTLSNLVEGNPANAFIFLKQSRTCASLCELVPSLKEGMREAMSYFISQILRYSVQVPTLTYLIHTALQDYSTAVSSCNSPIDQEQVNVSTAINEVKDDHISDAGGNSKQTLFMLGRVAEWQAPSNFLHFNLNPAVASGINMPPVSQQSNSGISVCGWVRLSGFGSASFASLFQLHDTTKNTVIDVFFRTLNKVPAPTAHHSETSSLASSSMHNDGDNPTVKRYIQLCITSRNISSKVGDKIQALEGKEASEVDTAQAHWSAVVSQLCSQLHDSNCSVNSTASHDDVHKNASSLASCICKYSIPDAIVDFDWSEMGNWHLVSVTITPMEIGDGQERITCMIDGVPCPILHWTPLGYEQLSTPIGARRSIVTSQLPKGTIALPDMPPSFLSDISKTNELLVTIGGINVEKKAYIDLMHKISWQNDVDGDNDMSTMSDFPALHRLVESFSALIKGFCGSLSEFIVLPAKSFSVEDMTAVYQKGPSHSLVAVFSSSLTSALQASALTSLASQVDKSTSSALSLNSRGLSQQIDSHGSTLGFSSFKSPTLPTAASAVSSPTLTKNRSISSTGPKIFSSNVLPLPREKSHSSSSFWDSNRPFDVQGGSVHLVKLSETVQLHRTSVLMDALHCMGSYKALYPLMVKDTTRYIVSLRIINAVMGLSEDNAREFFASSTDKLIFYCSCCHWHGTKHVNSLELIQVIFDMCIKQQITYSGKMSGIGAVVERHECFHRLEMLNLLVNIISSLPKNHSLARNCIDWLREVCDDEVHNGKAFLNSIGIVPILIILSMWAVGEVGKELQDRMSGDEQLKALENDKGTSLVTASAESVMETTGESGKLRSAATSAIMNDNENQEKNVENDVNRFIEKYKLLISCNRFIRVLITGTSGEGRLHDTLDSPLNATKTGFSGTHTRDILSFAAMCVNDFENISQSSSWGTDANHFSKIRNNRMLHGAIIETLPFRQKLATERGYWLMSGALVALDSLLNLRLSVFDSRIVTMVKESFSGNKLFHIILHLISSRCVELRERALQLLLIAFSAADGELDQKQVIAFDRMGGFRVMADCSTQYTDSCSSGVMSCLFNLLFWFRDKKTLGGDVVKSSVINGQVTNSRQETDVNDDKKESFLRKKVGEVQNDQAPAPNADSSTDRGVIGAAEHQQGTSTAGSGLMSFFSWGAGTPSSQPNDQFKEEDSSPTRSISAAGGQGENQSIDFKKNEEVASDAVRLSDQSDSSLQCSYEIRESHTKVTNNPSSIVLEQKAAVSCPEKKAVGGDDHREIIIDDQFDVIRIPQVLETIFRTLRWAKSSDILHDSFMKLTRCILPLREQEQQSFKLQQQLHRSAGGTSNTFGFAALSKATSRSDIERSHVFANRNCDSIFSQRDWFVWLCDLIAQLQRNIADQDDAQLEFLNASMLSQSENESIGAAPHLFGASGVSVIHEDSEESVGGEDITSDGGGNTNSLRHHHMDISSSESIGNISGTSSQQQGALFNRFLGPIVMFVRRVLIMDMTVAKVNSNSRWNEIFRLSTPEGANVQEMIILDLLDAVPLLSVANDYCDGSSDTVINILRNIGGMLEQAFEKTSVSLYFGVKVVQSLHALTYHCAPEVRQRMKETMLPEVRRSYVVRCLLDNSQEFFAKVAALSEISSPLQDYLSSSDPKPLADTHVVVLILALLVEACEDLEFVMGGVNETTDIVSNIGFKQTGVPKGTERAKVAASPVMPAAFDRFQISFEVMEVLVSTIQLCASSSQECRSFILKMIEGGFGSAKTALISCFAQSFAEIQQAGNETYNAQVNSDGLSSNSNNSATKHLEEAYTSRPVDTTSATPPRNESRWFNGWISSGGETEIVNTRNPIENWANQDLENGIGEQIQKDVAAIEHFAQRHEDEQDDIEGASNEIPWNLRSFIEWFCSPEQREMQSVFRARVTKEFRSTQRVLDKLRERWIYRFTRYTRLMQEKRNKETMNLSRLVKDATAVKQQAVDKEVSKVQRKLKALDSNLIDSYEAGRALSVETIQDMRSDAQRHKIDGTLKRSNDSNLRDKATTKTSETKYTCELDELAKLILEKRVEEVMPTLHSSNGTHPVKGTQQHGAATAENRKNSNATTFPVSYAEQLDILVHYFSSSHDHFPHDRR